LEPEILIVDEVLAVGDADFQKKCLGKMSEVAGQGRTVLFVSHNMAAVQNLCTDSFVLNKGVITLKGSPYDTVREYLTIYNSEIGFGEQDLTSIVDRKGNGNARLKRIRILDNNHQVATHIDSGADLVVEIEFEVIRSLYRPVINIGFDNELGQRVASFSTKWSNLILPSSQKGGVVKLKIDSLNLIPTTYVANIGIAFEREDVDWIPSAVRFEITSPLDNRGHIPKSGFVVVNHEWEHRYE